MKPLFSIITISYNAAATIERTIRRVVAPDIPVASIVLDGGATAGTQDIFRKY